MRKEEREREGEREKESDVRRRKGTGFKAEKLRHTKKMCLRFPIPNDRFYS